MDSSLIFLALVAMSGAYLVPHALRRRQQLTAARATDRFSGAMRVLARRAQDDSPVPSGRGQDAVRPVRILSSPVLGPPAAGRRPAGTVAAASAPPAARCRRPGQATCRPARLLLGASLLAAGTAAVLAALPAMGVVAPTPLPWPALLLLGAGQLTVAAALLRLRARRVVRRTARRPALRLPEPVPESAVEPAFERDLESVAVPRPA